MKKNVFIHVGLHKTGSSYLQREIFPNLQTPDSKDRFYNNLPIDPGRKKIISFVNSINHNNVFYFTDRANRANILISEEGLSGNIHANFSNAQIIRRNLKSIFPGAKIIVIIRKQDEFLESLYRQLLHEGRTQTVRKFLNYRNGSFCGSKAANGMGINISVKEQNWHLLVNDYLRLFGGDNVLVMPYELLKADKKEFLDRLFKFMNTDGFYPTDDRVIINRGYSLPSSYIALALNRFLKRDYNRYGFIIERPFFGFLERKKSENIFYKILARISSKMSLMSFLLRLDSLVYIKGNLIKKEVKRLIIDIHRSSNEKLDKQIRLGLKKFGYY